MCQFVFLSLKDIHSLIIFKKNFLNMKNSVFLFIYIILVQTACKEHRTENKTTNIMTDHTESKAAYSTVNGIDLYYEVYGKGLPLVLLHGGGSTISSCFGRIIPDLSKHYQVIAIELQNHGRSGNREVPQTFEQDADDVAVLLKNIGIKNAVFFGFSNGGSTALQIGIRHPEIVNKLIVLAAVTKRNGMFNGFFDMMQHTTIADMPEGLKKAFLEVNPDSAKLQIMFERDRDRMVAFKDWKDEDIKSIKAPTLIMNGDKDVITNEHALEMHRLIANSQLAIIPGTHGACIGEITTLTNGKADVRIAVGLIEKFIENK